MKKKLLVLILSLLMIATCGTAFVACGDGSGGDGDKAVSKIEVTTLPTKTQYYVGEEFSAEGGELTVTYSDKTTGKVALTANGVELSQPDMSRTGNKTITVTYKKARARFSISVQNQGFKLTYDYNYEGSSPTTQDIVKGNAAKKPTDPTRDGHTFYAWYANKDCTIPYDFNLPVLADTTIYAAWKENGTTYYEVTYDLNYYGIKPSSYTQIVASGETAKALGITPTRKEYSFDGWYNEAGDAEYVMTAPVAADTKICAKWTKTKSGSSTYTFEAENTDLTGKTGPGFSGSAQEGSMVIMNSSASNGKAVSYMYQNGNSLEFYIASDVAVDDAKLVLSLGAEMDNISFNSTEFQVVVNDTALSYTNVSLQNNNKFSDAITIEGVNLKAGANLIVLKVNNSRRPMGDASTYAATAPMIDCIKITTTAVLFWDANYGLPVEW
ncbi:MAG: InlB B-repeat-containing protein [Clostridiales bacterium]|nr:InlB B-repeat-containing protein [Clostridiales bacterium]